MVRGRNALGIGGFSSTGSASLKFGKCSSVAIFKKEKGRGTVNLAIDNKMSQFVRRGQIDR